MRSALICWVIGCGPVLSSAAAKDTGEKIESLGTLITLDVKPGQEALITRLANLYPDVGLTRP